MAAPEDAEAITVSFKMPSGFAPPEGVEEGSPFEAVANVRIEDGMVIVDTINGLKIGGEEAEDEEIEDETLENEEEAEDGGSLAAAMQASGVDMM